MVLARWFPALEDARVRLYLAGQALSVMGTWLLDVTLNLLAWKASGSPVLLGTLNFLLFAPSVVVTPLFAARLTAANARRSTLAVLWAMLAVALALLALHQASLLTLPAMLAVAALRGLVSGMEMPSRQMLLTTSVQQREHIASAVALNVVVFQIARLAGPALAGVLFETAGAGWSFALGTAGLAFMLWCVHGLAAAAGAGSEADSSRPGLRAALAWVRSEPFAQLFLTVTVLQGLFTTGYQTLIPVLADRVFGNAAGWTGAFYAAIGTGSLAAALLLSTGRRHAAMRHLLVPMPWLTTTAMAGLALSRWAVLTLACFALLGFGFSFVATSTNSVLHERVPPAVRGGLIALFLGAIIASMPLSQLLAGALAQFLSAPATFGIMAAGLAATLAVTFAQRWRVLGRIEWNAERI